MNTKDRTSVLIREFLDSRGVEITWVDSDDTAQAIVDALDLD